MSQPLQNEKYAQKPHILVVDDDGRIRELVSRYLHEHGFVVLGAGDAAQAQGILERFACDAIVLDVMMPGQSGLEFTRSLRAAGRDIPVLLLTALGEAGDRPVLHTELRQMLAQGRGVRRLHRPEATVAAAIVARA